VIYLETFLYLCRLYISLSLALVLMMTSLLIFLAVTHVHYVLNVADDVSGGRTPNGVSYMRMIYHDSVISLLHYLNIFVIRARGPSLRIKKNIHSIPHSIFKHSMKLQFSPYPECQVFIFCPHSLFLPPLIAGTSPLENQCFFVEGAKPLIFPLCSRFGLQDCIAFHGS